MRLTWNCIRIEMCHLAQILFALAILQFRAENKVEMRFQTNGWLCSVQLDSPFHLIAACAEVSWTNWPFVSVIFRIVKCWSHLNIPLSWCEKWKTRQRHAKTSLFSRPSFLVHWFSRTPPAIGLPNGREKPSEWKFKYFSQSQRKCSKKKRERNVQFQSRLSAQSCQSEKYHTL